MPVSTGRVMSTGKRGDDWPQRIYSAASQAMIAGATVEWQRLLPWQGRHMVLPNYPWQRESYWHAANSGIDRSARPQARAPAARLSQSTRPS